jgi:DNA-binding winged helix-turn-helix (wHTH) protein
VDTLRRKVFRGDRPVPSLQRKDIQLLLALIDRSGQVVGREELLNLVWKEAMVEPGNIDVRISRLRRVLGSDCIETAHGEGYVFCERIESAPEEPASDSKFLFRRVVWAKFIDSASEFVDTLGAHVYHIHQLVELDPEREDRLDELLAAITGDLQLLEADPVEHRLYLKTISEPFKEFSKMGLRMFALSVEGTYFSGKGDHNGSKWLVNAYAIILKPFQFFVSEFGNQQVHAFNPGCEVAVRTLGTYFWRRQVPQIIFGLQSSVRFQMKERCCPYCFG